MAELKTQRNDGNVRDFLESVEHPTRRTDGLVLLDLFEHTTGLKAELWGNSLVGFGSYHYKSERSTQEGDWPLTGFSPRKQNLTIYLMDGPIRYAEELKELGKHKISQGSCLYINKLADVDLDVLKRVIKVSFTRMNERFNS